MRFYMFTVYYSNNLTDLAEMLVQHQQVAPNEDPFASETVLVQSVGMAQWLQMYIADKLGIAAHYEFPFPTSFLWQQYRLLFPYLPKENIFEREVMSWRLMRIIPTVLEQAEFKSLRTYLYTERDLNVLKLYQLASKIADLFDQYLVYRPHWLVHWENNQIEAVIEEIQQSLFNKIKNIQEIKENIIWQSILWNLLIQDTRKEYDELLFNTSHRAYLQEQYFNKLSNLSEIEREKLPKRIFIFGISSLPATQLNVLAKLSEYCQVHLFFLNPSQKYWGDNIEDKALEKMALKQQLSNEDIDELIQQQGNQLLSIWGKQGRDFLSQLVELEHNVIEAFSDNQSINNLSLLKQAILNNENNIALDFNGDNSIQIHSCHSAMREVEVLHNQLLQIFQDNPDLSPKDIIVMSADIENYIPYINAVFSRYDKTDKRYIPFTISDQKITKIDPVIASFVFLLSIKESNFNAESLLDLLEVQTIRERFGFNLDDIERLREWIKASGIRAELNINQNDIWQNYNSWENGLNRLLLGGCLKEENGIWQDSIAFNESYGLAAELVGKLAIFIERLKSWDNLLKGKYSILEWKVFLLQFIRDFYQENEASTYSLIFITQEIEKITEIILKANYLEPFEIDILVKRLAENLNNEQNQLHFLVGKVNFCTLLPMRAIPFKVVCLLGMNEADFPRQHSINSFDLMQYQPQKGDRARRDDDRYLFLEALLSAQEIFYISYVGQSLIKNEKREPSILVAQLLDYFAEFSNLQDPKLLVQQHPMSAFSLANFRNNYISYASEWLAFAKQAVDFQDFLAKELPAENEIPQFIELAELITFVQSPIKYFFNQRLGIQFKEEDDSIEETEHFDLSKLDEYQLLNQLVVTPEDASEKFFHQESLKGNIPVLNFGKIKQHELESRIQKMRSGLSGYLLQTPTILDISISLDKFEIVGNIPEQFNEGIILWRTGNLRDKDIIKLWIYHLVLTVSKYDKPIKFYYLKDDELMSFEFNKINLEQAIEVLNQYVYAYLKNFSQLTFAITSSLDKYFGEEPEDIESYCKEKLFDLTNTKNSEAIYLARILAQTEKLNYLEIHQNTLNWFGLMQRSQGEK